ncbi:MAG: TOBE domain-containing protein, partial [Rhodoferax sp.]|nr:TOBE domain-containing protein [Rhodoferax sp.]
PLPCAMSGGACDVLLRADDIVHDDDAPVRAEILRKAFRGADFLYTLRLASGDTVMALVPSHHDHRVGEHIGIRAQVDHVVTFNRDCPRHDGQLCHLPCQEAATPPAPIRLPEAGPRRPADRPPIAAGSDPAPAAARQN